MRNMTFRRKLILRQGVDKGRNILWSFAEIDWVNFLVTQSMVAKAVSGREHAIAGLATRLLFYSVGRVELVDKAALIEFFHELSIDQVFRLQPRHGGILQLHQPLDIAQTFEGGKGFRSVA